MPTQQELNKFNQYLLQIVIRGTKEQLKNVLERNASHTNEPSTVFPDSLNIGREAFIEAMNRSKIDMARLLAKYVVNINFQDNNGETLLIQAVKNQDIDRTKLMIEMGADINLRDNLNNNALHYAVGGFARRNYDGSISYVFGVGNAELTELLINAGAAVNIYHNIYNISELTSCIRDYRNAPVLESLINSGRYTPDQLNGALFIAAGIGGSRTDILDTLIKIGNVNVNLKDQYGWTPLAYAANLCNVNNIKCLLEAGAEKTTFERLTPEANEMLSEAVKEFMFEQSYVKSIQYRIELMFGNGSCSIERGI